MMCDTRYCRHRAAWVVYVVQCCDTHLAETIRDQLGSDVTLTGPQRRWMTVRPITPSQDAA